MLPAVLTSVRGRAFLTLVWSIRVLSPLFSYRSRSSRVRVVYGATCDLVSGMHTTVLVVCVCVFSGAIIMSFVIFYINSAALIGVHLRRRCLQTLPPWNIIIFLMKRQRKRHDTWIFSAWIWNGTRPSALVQYQHSWEFISAQNTRQVQQQRPQSPTVTHLACVCIQGT